MGRSRQQRLADAETGGEVGGVPVRKPGKAWWVRVHPDPAYSLSTAVVELKEDRETYLVAPAAAMARDSWVRVAANMHLGAYDVYTASGQLADPDWPETPFRELLATAFKDKLIDTLDHPVLRKLRGEV